MKRQHKKYITWNQAEYRKIQSRRKLLANVISYKIIYAALIWAKTMDKESYKKEEMAVYRICAFRIARTVGMHYFNRRNGGMHLLRVAGLDTRSR